MVLETCLTSYSGWSVPLDFHVTKVQKISETTKHFRKYFRKKYTKEPSLLCTNFYEIGGDANGDGEVTVTDIGVIVDMILGNDANGGNYGNARRMTDDTVEPQ